MTLKCGWRVFYNSERVFSTFQVTQMGLFTGLDCSCFRQIYCSSLLEDPGNFPVEKSKGRKANLQWALSMCQNFCFLTKSWLDLVALEGFQSQGSHVGLWDELGNCREQKPEIVFGWFGFGVSSWVVLHGLHLAEDPNLTHFCHYGITALPIPEFPVEILPSDKWMTWALSLGRVFKKPRKSWVQPPGMRWTFLKWGVSKKEWESKKKKKKNTPEVGMESIRFGWGVCN